MKFGQFLQSLCDSVNDHPELLDAELVMIDPDDADKLNAVTAIHVESTRCDGVRLVWIKNLHSSNDEEHRNLLLQTEIEFMARGVPYEIKDVGEFADDNED
jgi:hypothetical protein